MIIWKLEQNINFGLGNTRLSRHSLTKYLSILNIDDQKKKFLKFLLSS
jgi:hypothetical protein